MNRTHPSVRPHRSLRAPALSVAAVLILLIPVVVRSVQKPDSGSPALPDNKQVLAPPTVDAKPTASKQTDGANKSPRDKTKSDAATLSTLADQLRDELNKMNANVLSLDVIQKTQELERLAKKIKAEADEH